AQTADGAGDHETLDLGGAFEDRVDLRVSVPPFDRVLAGVAISAEDLDRLFRHLHCDLAGLQLRHRTLARDELLAVASHPRSAPHEQASGVDLDLHVREL